MQILVLDSNVAAGTAIANNLKRAHTRPTLNVWSMADALDALAEQKDSIGIVVFFLESNPESGLSFIDEVKVHCARAAIRVPKFVVLTPGDLTGAYVRRFWAVNAQCVAYGAEEQLRITVGGLLFDPTLGNGRPTIVVERAAFCTKFWLLGSAGRELIGIGPRLGRLMNYFAIHYLTELSTAELADSAEISLVAVRVYLERLRKRFDEAAQRIGVNSSGKDVFCTFRKDGGFVHVLRARVLFY